MKYYYVTQRKVVKVNGVITLDVTDLVGYNMNKTQCDEAFYCFNGSVGHKASTKQLKEDDAEITISNSYGGHNTKLKNDSDAYEKLIKIPNEFNNALSVINKYGFDAVEKGVAGNKVKVVSYQQAVGL